MWSARHSPLNLASRLLPVFFFMMYSHTINTIPISSIGFSVSSTGSTMSFANPKPSYDTVLGQKKLPKKSNQCVVNSWKEWGFLNPCLKHLRQELEWDHKPINSTLSSTSHSQLWEVYLGSSSCIWCVNLLATVVDFGTCLEMITGGKVVKIYIYICYIAIEMVLMWDFSKSLTFLSRCPRPDVYPKGPRIIEAGQVKQKSGKFVGWDVQSTEEKGQWTLILFTDSNPCQVVMVAKFIWRCHPALLKLAGVHRIR